MSIARVQRPCGNPTPKAKDKRTPGQRMAAERKAARRTAATATANRADVHTTGVQHQSCAAILRG